MRIFREFEPVPLWTVNGAERGRFEALKINKQDRPRSPVSTETQPSIGVGGSKLTLLSIVCCRIPKLN